MNRLVFSVIVGIMIAVMAGVYSDSVSADLSGSVVRLHIIANSDSEEDQRVKLLVRDAVIKNGTDNLSEIAEIAGEVLVDNGFSYGAIVSRGKYYFPTKEYKNVRMPAGMYNAVRITLGEGIGRNWWCVMYPPLCFTEECTGEMSDDGMAVLKNGINDESADIITGNGVEIEMKFKIVETVQELHKKYFS